MDNKVSFNQKMPSDDEIEKYMDLDGLMARHQEQQKIAFMALVLLSMRRNARRIVVASTIILFTGLSVFAFIKIVDRKGNSEAGKEKNNLEKVEPVSQALLKDKFYSQNILLDVKQDLLVKGGLGTEFFVPAGCFLSRSGEIIRDTVSFGVIELINKKALKENNLRVNYKGKTYLPEKVYHLSASGKESDISINKEIPIELVTGNVAPEDLKIFYGTEENGKLGWTEESRKALVSIITPSMLEFQKYEDSKKLLDSLKQYYFLDEEWYKPISNSGMVYSKKFIKETAIFIQRYQEDRSFDIKVKKAISDWEIYLESRKILINAVGNRKAPETIKIYKTGWIAIIKI